MDPTALQLVLSVLSYQTRSQDIKHLLQVSQFEDFISSTITHLRSADLISTPIYENFASSLGCFLCKTTRCEVVLDCHHQFCMRCLYSHALSASNNFEIPFASIRQSLTCPQCTAQVSESDTSEIFQRFWPEPASPIKKFSYEPGMLLRKCTECNMNRHPNKFYYTCNHLCLYCGFRKLVENKACTVCWCTTTTPAVNTVRNGITCQGCKKTKIITEDYVVEICKEHVHCYECLKLAWRDMRCRVCERHLDFSSQNALRKHIFSKCSACKDVLEIKFMVKKECCRDFICISCQKTTSNSNCKACGRQLAPQVTARLEKLCVPG